MQFNPAKRVKEREKENPTWEHAQAKPNKHITRDIVSTVAELLNGRVEIDPRRSVSPYGDRGRGLYEAGGGGGGRSFV